MLPVNDGPSDRWSGLPSPHARQDGANDGFILFTTDRDNPSPQGMCDPPQCEDIYVMAPDGTNPARLTHGGGAPNDPAATTVAGPTGPTARS